MDLRDFIEKFTKTLEIESPDEVNFNTDFKNLPEWGSLAILSIIAMIDEEYDAEINPNEIKKAQTIQDLFDLVSSKK